MYYFSQFLAELFCSLTENNLGTEVSCRWRADNMWMMCGWHADNVRMTREWDFIGDFGWWMTYVIRTLSAHRLQACMLSAHSPQTCMSSAHHLQHSSWSAWTWTIFLLWQELVIKWNLSQECWAVSFQDHVNDLSDNLCWWFSLHVASGHCSHVICICTCHPHIIWAYAYYAHIICSGPWYIPS